MLAVALALAGALVSRRARAEDTPAPPTRDERIVVAASRTPEHLDDSPASVTILSADAIEVSGSLALDDVLRQTPGFSLFRRTSSRTANPTAQGAALRGIGASGASRALVLDDGVPLNDPFGGWVLWGRVPRASLSRVEIVRGGASDLYGSGALSGVIDLVRRRAGDAPHVVAEGTAGSQRTADASLFAAIPAGDFAAEVSAETFTTAGEIPVAPEERGPVDARAASRRGAVDLTLARRPESGASLFARGSLYTESRDNGTALQTNASHARRLVLGLDAPALSGTLAARVFGERQTLDQSFSAIAADRASERLTSVQRVPASSLGATLQLGRAFGAAHVVVVGVEGREIRGESDERLFSAGGPPFRDAGGEQLLGAVRAEDVMRLGTRVTATVGGRLDTWQNRDAFRETGGARQDLASHRESAFSPRAALLVGLSDAIALRASVYRSFRAPTLNELYRSFRVGNVVTNANERLGAERLSGAEVGATLSLGRVSARATAFAAEVENPVANVTLSASDALVVRERRNLGRLRSRGVELEATWRVRPGLDATLSWTGTDAIVASFPGSPSLEGRRVPQVPRHGASARVLWSTGRLLAGVTARYGGPQYEDDRNEQLLAAFGTVDALVSVTLGRSLAVVLAGENLTDERIETGRTPATTLGTSRVLRAGVRFTTP